MIANGQVQVEPLAEPPVDLLPQEPDDYPVPPPTETYAQHIAILKESIAAMEAGDPCLTLEEVLASMDAKLVAIGAIPGS